MPTSSSRRRAAGTGRGLRSLTLLSVVAVLGVAVILGGAAAGRSASPGRAVHVTWAPRTAPAPPGTYPSIRRAAESWCLSGETSSDRSPGGWLSSSTIRVLYAVPSDQASRFAALANGMVTDVAAIDRWWRGQDASRAPRWDTAPTGGCTGLQALDLGSVRLPRPAAAYRVEAGFGLLAADVSDALTGDQKALVFFDGTYQDPDICGISYEEPTTGGRLGVSSMALGSSCAVDPGAGGLVARVAVHELTHDLGAVEASAPHSCPDSGHVCDTRTDLMYPYVDGDSTLANAVLDVGHDDYYDHSGAWFDVRDSGWLAHLPLRTVTVSVAGGGTVTSAPAAIDCGSRCTAQAEDGDDLTLTANATPPSAFLGWSGACTGTGPCDLEPTADVSVRATFGTLRPLLRVTVSGKGRVTSTPVGIACPTRCSVRVEGRVTLRATPAKGWRLASWKPACGRTSVCRVSVTRATSVRATFARTR